MTDTRRSISHVEAPSAEGTDLAIVAAYLARQPTLSAWLPLLAIERLGHGQSNVTLELRTGGGSLILRRPPPGPLPPSAHDVLREHRVMSALYGSGVRVPRMLAAARAEETELGVPFFLMEALPGDALRFELPAALGDGAPPEWRRTVGEQFVDALAQLHATDPARVGLADLGKATGYIARQVKRWIAQLDFARVRDTGDLDWVTAWLQQHIPPTADPTVPRIVHGDAKLDNAIFSLEARPRLLALVDWEMATLGDPLADLGWLLAFWREAGDDQPELRIIPRVTEAPGFSTRAELVERYAEQVGLSRLGPPELRFYVVLAMWKMAVLLEGHWARHVRGSAGDFSFEYLEHGGPAFWRRIRDTARSAD